MRPDRWANDESASAESSAPESVHESSTVPDNLPTLSPTSSVPEPLRAEDVDRLMHSAAAAAAAANDAAHVALPPEPPGHAREIANSRVCVYSHDEHLIEVVIAAAGAHHEVRAVGQWSTLVGAIADGSAEVVLLDADVAGNRLEKQIAALAAAPKPCVLSVAAPREVAQRLMGFVSDCTIHRLLIKPAPVGITRLLLDSAAVRYAKLRARTPAAPTAGKGARAKALATRWPPWLLATALASLLAGVVAVGMFVRGRVAQVPAAATADAIEPPSVVAGAAAATRDPPAAVPSAAEQADAGPGAQADAPAPAAAVADIDAPSAADEPAADTLPEPVPESEIGLALPGADPYAARLAEAEAAAAAGQIAEPIGASAVDIYAAILAEDSRHAEARRQLDLLVERLYGDVEWALLEGAVDDAAATATHIRRVQPSSGRLIFLENQIDQARQRVAATGGLSAAQAAELDGILATVRDRMAAEQLTTPSGDSALEHLGRAAALAPQAPVVVTVRAELAAAFAAAARAQLQSGDIDRAATLVQEARALGLDDNTSALLDLGIETARQRIIDRQHGELLASGIERLDAGQLVAPEDDSALYYLTALRAANPEFSGLAAVWNRFVAAVEADVAAAVMAGNPDAAQRLVDALVAASFDPQRVEAMRTNIESSRLQAEYLANAAPTGELELAATGTIEYPQGAQSRGVEGWVEFEYVVDAEGVPTNIRVVAADPEGWFEEAALASISQYRYVPFVRDGRVYERLARVRINFQLEE